MDNNSMWNAYLPVNRDGSSESRFTDITRESSPIRQALNWDEEHTPGHDIQYLNADFDHYYSLPDLHQSPNNSLSNHEWSQYLAPVANHIQNCEDHGKMSFVNPVDVIGTSSLDAVDNDQPQSSLATSFHPVNCPETQAAPVQCPELTSSGTSAPSSTPATSSQSYTLAPETAGQAPNSANTTNVNGSGYTCNDCHISAKTKRDWERHCKTNKHKARGSLSNGSNGSSDNGIPGAAASTGFHCPVEGCKYHSSTGRAITRDDNLRRHVKTVHGMDMGRNREE